MPLKTGLASQSQQREGTGGDNVPPSTIAAQIVQNHDLATSGRQFQDHELFGQLLQEILAHSEAEYADTITLYKLVTIVIKGGLLALGHNDPFTSKEKYVSRAITSVKVIELTIRRNPEILLDSSLSDVKDGLRPPLFLIVFSSVVTVLGYEDIAKLLPFIRRLLYCCIQEILNTSDLWLRAFALIDLYQSCVQCIMYELHNLSSSISNTFAVTLPTSRSIRSIFSGSESLVALPPGCQTTIRSPWQALVVCLYLLDPILELSCNRYTSALIHFKRSGYLEGVVETSLDIKRILKRLKFAHIPRTSDHLLLTAYVRSLELILLASEGLDKQYISQHGFEPVIVSCLTEVLELRLSALENGDLPIDIKRVLLRLLANNFGGLDVHLPEVTILLQAILRAACSSTWNDGPARELKSVCELWLGNRVINNVATTHALESQYNVIDQNVDNHDYKESDSAEEAQRKYGVLNEHPLNDSDINQRPLKKRKLFRNEDNRLAYGESRAKRFDFEFVLHMLASDRTKGDKLDLKWYKSYRKVEREYILKSISLLPCFQSNCLDRLEDSGTLECCICDQDINYSPPIDWDQGTNGEQQKRLILLLELLTASPEVVRSKRHRILLILAIRRILKHTTESAPFDLVSGKIGQWCLKCLHSSCRELRIAAGKLLALFLADRLPEYLWRKNRVYALDYLKSITETQEVYIHETAILVLGRMTNVCGSDELNLILLRLADYLGHPNPFICSVAYNEFVQVADDMRCSVLDLLSPFWRSVAVTIVKDLQVRPQKAQYLADLLGMSVNQFLLHTQSETLPYLVLTKKKDILQRIAKARNTNIQDMCVQPRRHLAFIIALLLRQDTPNAEKYVMDLLCHASSGFSESDFSTLVMLEPVVIACELLKCASDEDKEGKRKVYRAIEKLSAVAGRKSLQGKTTANHEKYSSVFFESHILGIMANFSEVIDARIHQNMPEKLRCLRAVEELINLAKGELGAALPQIRACLQSALEIRDLRDQAFSAWCKLITNLEYDEDVNWLIEQTFAIIAQYSSSFPPRVQQQAQNVMSYLLKNYAVMIKEHIVTIPSLAGISTMSNFESEIMRLKSTLDLDGHLQAYSVRLDNDNATIVLQALREFLPFLDKSQEYFHDLVLSQPVPKIVSEITRALLDISVRFTEAEGEMISLCSQCLGVIGCLDYNRVESTREKKEILIVSNFERANEVVDFVTYLLSNILVKSFLSATSARAQGFLAYVMQELLKFCGYHEVINQRSRQTESASIYSKWTELPVQTRSTLIPFLSSRYLLTSNLSYVPKYEQYPIFSADISHGVWLRHFVFDLLLRGKGDNAKMIFSVLSRIIRGHDLAIATFLLPFAVLNVLLGGVDKEAEQIRNELRIVIECEIGNASQSQATNIKLCSENVFQILEYLSRFSQEKKRALEHTRMMNAKIGKKTAEFEEARDIAQINIVEQALSEIPAQLISKRAVECGSYARALFHWEQFIRQQKDKEIYNITHGTDSWYQNLLDIYLKIDEPDAIEGVSTHLQLMTVDDQVLEHRKAGRWAAVQSWHELQLAQRPDDPNVQLDLLKSLGESGSYDAVLTYADKFLQHATSFGISKIMPRAAEASWVTGNWSLLRKELSKAPASVLEDFEVCISRALIALADNKRDDFNNTVSIIRQDVTKSLTPSSTASLQACHSPLLKLHILYELEASSGLYEFANRNRSNIMEILDKRLEVLGAYLAEKQYILSIRRAVLQLSYLNFENLDVAALWLKSARLARKANVTKAAFSSVLKASSLGDDTAKIEHSRLLWKEGYHRQAIKVLEGAIAANAFQSSNSQITEDIAETSRAQLAEQNFTNAQARLLLGKWLERSGQTPSQTIIDTYFSATKAFTKWDKGYYYIGKHYNKLLESEKLLAPNKQSKLLYVKGADIETVTNFLSLSGELAWLVVQHYLLSLHYGTKYYYQTIPRIVTLWLDLGTEVYRGGQRPTDTKQHEQRSRWLETMHRQLKKYVERLPAYAFYVALPQILSRISHPNQKVYEVLAMMIIKMVATHPQQALWSLLAVAKSSSRDRAGRGISLLNKLKEHGKRSRSDNSMSELRTMINSGQKLSDQLLRACEAPVEPKVSHVSLSRDLGFYHKVAPCPLVVPIENTLTLSLPPVHDVQHMRTHKAFPQKPITIQVFQDDVLVLSSLQRPRKITVRGSDGILYGLLCKPKDDLRKDQRLMEFNSMINRALKRDVESSKRQLSIKTYGVTPLNEECGTIEWVDNLKPLRDIILQLYRQKNIRIDYSELRVLLAEAAEAPGNVHIFTDQILPKFRSVLHEWFIETFPGPEAWYSARLMFTRTSAVMSIVGHVLGLGDRHGENLLLREGHGGVLHVDFNCLFDKGLTFDKPEVVPFRLTHNMIDAMGPYGYEGPFRKAAELTLTILRQHQDTLMTILETFLYDPTADFIGKKKRPVPGVPDTPPEVLDSIRTKLGGLLRGESVPLSVEGYVEALIAMATDPQRLAAMYIGWCAFL